MISLYALQRFVHFTHWTQPEDWDEVFQKRSPTPNGKPVHLSHLHLLALHGRGFLQRTRLSQSPYGQRLYMEASSHQVCLIFLSLDGAHLRSEGRHHDVLYTTNTNH